ncbi:MAG: WYL domain-containing protein [Actinomycetota bacterium]
MSSKAERLMNLMIMLLNATRPVTADEIQRTIPGYDQDKGESFKRMFERDKDELREMGIPVERGDTDAWGFDEGYKIPKERYYLPQLELSDEELASLWVAAGLLRLQDPASVRIAMMKLGSDEPADDVFSSRVTADFGLSLPTLPRAFEAVTERKSVTFKYRSASGERTRRVDPYGLVHRKGAWYIVGRDHDHDEPRTFRLDRIDGEIHYNDPSGPAFEFAIPEGFNPATALELPPFVQGEPQMKATVRFDPSTAWLVERGSPWLTLDWAHDGSATADISVTDAPGFISWLLWFDDGVEVIAPPELRGLVRDRLDLICG